MPFVVTATGPAGLPATQAEVDARRAERLAKRAVGGGAVIGKKAKKPRKKKPSVTDGMETNTEKVGSAIERRLIKIVPTPVPEWPDAPPDLLVVLPGAKGHRNYIFNIKDRLKADGFHWDEAHKLWYHTHAKLAPPEGFVV